MAEYLGAPVVLPEKRSPASRVPGAQRERQLHDPEVLRLRALPLPSGDGLPGLPLARLDLGGAVGEGGDLLLLRGAARD